MGMIRMKLLRLRAIAFVLLVSMLLTLIPIQTSYAADSFAPPSSTAAAGGAGATPNNPNVNGKGVWHSDMQGFRISVLDYSGDPAFTFMGKDSLDLLFSNKNISAMQYFGNGDKLSGTRSTKMSTSEISSQLYTLDAIYGALKNGTFDTTLPKGANKATAIERMKKSNVSKYLTQETSNGKAVWVKWGSEVRKDFYGSGKDMDLEAMLYTILNLQMVSGDKSTWLWQPKSSAYFGNTPITASEKAAFASNKLSPVELMASKTIVVTVEPIIWNKLRIDANTYAWGVYGTQTTVGGIIDWLVSGGWYRPSYGATWGGFDESLFGRVGRKAMVMADNYIYFHSYTSKPSGERVVGKWNVLPPTDSGQKVLNTEVYLRQPGWSLHAYLLKKPGDQTHTYDSHNYPITDPNPHGDNPNYKEHPAPDPKTDPCTSDKINSLLNKLHYRIVKVYDQEVLYASIDENGELTLTKGTEHVSTHVREQTLPKIEVQDEMPEYRMVEWKYTYDQYVPVTEGGTESTKWEDEPIAGRTVVNSDIAA